MIFTEQMTNDTGWLLAVLWCNCRGWVSVHKLRSKCNPWGHHLNLNQLFDILRLTQFFYFWISLFYLCREMFTGRCPNSNWGKWRWRPMGACNVKRVNIHNSNFKKFHKSSNKIMKVYKICFYKEPICHKRKQEYLSVLSVWKSYVCSLWRTRSNWPLA